VSGFRHRALIAHLAGRRLQARHRGSLLGPAWLLLQPALLLGIYTLVFSLLFEAKWGTLLGGRGEFGLFLFSGVLLYSIFSESVNAAPGLMLENERYITQIRFPIEILPWVSLVASFYFFFFGALVLLFFHCLLLGLPPVGWLVLPAILLPIALLTLGVTWFLSAVGVYFRDLSQITVMFTTALLFLSPVFYPASRIPDSLRAVYEMNPFAILLEASKHLLFFGDAPDWRGVAIVGAISFAVAGAGYAWFMRTKRGFADVV